MMKIFGSATLRINGEESDSTLILDLESGLIICRPLEKEIIQSHDIFSSDVTIRDFYARIPNGLISLEEFPNLIVKAVNPGQTDILDSMALTSFDFLENYKKCELHFMPSFSRIEFDFEPPTNTKNYTELHFVNASLTTAFDSNIYATSCKVVIDSRGHSLIRVEKELQIDQIDKLIRVFRTTCCLSQGIFSSVREVFAGEKLLLNLLRYELVRSPFRWIGSTEVKMLFEAIYTAFENSDQHDLRMYENAVYYLEGGFNQKVNLEFRIISLFTAFEIVDNSKTLDKSRLKDQFCMKSLYDAAFLINIRNKIVHRGFTINEAVSDSEMNVSENDHVNSVLTEYFAKYQKLKKGVVCYYYILDLLTEHLLRKFNFHGSFISSFSNT